MNNKLKIGDKVILNPEKSKPYEFSNGKGSVKHNEIGIVRSNGISYSVDFPNNSRWKGSGDDVVLIDTLGQKKYEDLIKRHEKYLAKQKKEEEEKLKKAYETNKDYLNTKLYIKECSIEDKPKKIRDFIRLFYNSNPDYKVTATTTYFDKECTLQHCEKLKLRSFDDLYCLIKTYYPRVTVSLVFYVLITTKMCIGDIKIYPALNVCTTMNRIRITFSKSYFYISNTNCIMRNSAYTWGSLLKMIGIKEWNREILQEYHDKHAK